MDLKIAGKKALMAGGSAGMGRATADRLAEAGVELYISARREERLLNAAKEITEKYGIRSLQLLLIRLPKRVGRHCFQHAPIQIF